MKMKNSNIFILLSLFMFTLYNCKQENILKGEWQFVQSSGCNINPLGLFAEIWPHSQYGHKIYFNKDSISIPAIMSENGLPFKKGFYTARQKLSISTLGEFDYIIENDTLEISSDSCIMKFIEVPLSTKMLNTIIKFERKDDNGDLIDSILVTKNEMKNQLFGQTTVGDYEFIFKLSNLIKEKDRNGYFGQNSNDVDCYYIELIDKKGEISKIKSCGKLGTPFEIRTLIRYTNKLLDSVPDSSGTESN